MNLLTALLAFLLVGFSSSFEQTRGRLTARRCRTPSTGDSTNSIRVIIDPPEAYGKSLSLMLSLLRPPASDSFLREPPYGVLHVSGLPAGLYRLRVRQIGYWHPQDTLRLGRGEAWCVTAHMVRDTNRLREIF
jgi:hypothetical protein